METRSEIESSDEPWKEKTLQRVTTFRFFKKSNRFFSSPVGKSSASRVGAGSCKNQDILEVCFCAGMIMASELPPTNLKSSGSSSGDPPLL
jgi:hypothetical protein